MNIFQRISKLVEANINNMLDKAEDPEVMVRQLIREMEESIIELRRETVKSIGAKKHLEKKIQLNRDREAELENKAALALESGKETLARDLLSKKLASDQARNHLEEELKTATYLAEKIKEDLIKLEDQVQIARRKKEEIIRRKLAAERHLRSSEALQKSRNALDAITGTSINEDEHINAIESYKDKILMMEAEAEAAEELLNPGKDEEAELEKMIQKKAVDSELARLKKQLTEGKNKK